MSKKHSKTAIIILSVVVILLSAALAGTYFHRGNSPKTAGAVQENKKDYFAKKVQCEEYGSNIKARIDKETNDYFQSTTASGKLGGYESFMLIFYSPKLNTCIYTSKAIGESADGSITAYNVLTHEKLKNFPPGKEGFYAQFVTEYSGGEIKF